MMNLYTNDLALFDFALSDPLFETLTRTSQSSVESDDASKPTPIDSGPPKHRHDGTSPLPLGMDWSPPPRKWDGADSVWPHDPHTGWSYCVTIPSWTILPKPRGSDPVVFYRVQIGIQSPEGITTTQGVLRRFNDFLKLFTELKMEFSRKKLPAVPPRRLLRMKSNTLLEERRCSLEDWMDTLLSDIDISRSVQVATFLELEAAVRSSFNNIDQHISEVNSTTGMGCSTSYASEYGDDTNYEISEIGTPRHMRDDSSELGTSNLISDQDLFGSTETISKYGMSNHENNGLHVGEFILENLERLSRLKILSKRYKHLSEPDGYKSVGHVRRLSGDSVGSDMSSVRASEISNVGDGSIDLHGGAEALSSQVPHEVLVALPSEERQKLSRVLTTMQQRLGIAKTDMEDIIARLNQELAVRQYLTTKVRDLEEEYETAKVSFKENLQKAILNERERFTQMQWDIEESQRQCLDTELKLKLEQDDKARIESTKVSIMQENEILLEELDGAREQIEKLKKHHEEVEAKSKADVKLLVKEVKSLRSTQLELKQELSQVIKENIEKEGVIHKEKQRRERANTASAKLLHEYKILRDRLQECSVDFVIEDDDKLVVDASSHSDAIDLLTTSENRTSLLLAEAQLLAQDVENAVASSDETESPNESVGKTMDEEVLKMLTEVVIDNARLRKDMNSVMRCALNTPAESEKDEEEAVVEVPVRRTVLSSFLSR